MFTEKELNKNIYSTKQLLAYCIITLDKCREKNTINFNDFIKEFITNIRTIHHLEILKKINIELIADFPIYHRLNYEELISYGIVVFYRLLKLNKDFTYLDIINQLEILMRFESARTILDLVKDIINS